ncbi:MAG: acyl-CoA carboxylase subunit beta, partial [Elusimicrobia bacterium]|nr:acyl-CoA carboxylase subunit beta [Elusimicrobiota bacterium]
LGLAHAMKICKVVDMAVAMGVPVVGLCDSGGARIQEGVDALGGYAEIFYRNVQASGRVPQISAILGPCAGGAVYSPAITDFVFMVKDTSHMFITGPEVIRAATGEECDFETLGGVEAHSTRSGVCHFVANSEPDCFRQIQELLEFLPQNCDEEPKPRVSADDPARESPVLDRIAHQDAKRPFSAHEVVREIADDRSFFEVHAGFARNIVVGFIHLGGRSVGVVANNPAHLSGALNISASEKGARFVRFCDAFNIPLLTLVDVPGYWPGVEQEHGGIIRKGAKLLYAYCQATVPKVTVVLKKAYGGAYDVMSSKHVRGDINFAWPCAEIAVMGPQGAVNILFAREIRKAAKPEERRKELVDEYTKQFANPYLAASRGYIDEVIEARRTRAKVINAFRLLRNKRVPRPRKKHGNIPL